jgi:hypothetical protein
VVDAPVVKREVGDGVEVLRRLFLVKGDVLVFRIGGTFNQCLRLHP